MDADSTSSPRSPALLTEQEAPPFHVIEGVGTSPYLVTCDHAGNRLPRALGDLGLTSAELATHIAWDIGAAGVAEHLGHLLGAFVILQTYSRLVIDCNRPLDQESSIVTQSEYTAVPGNRALSAWDAEVRAAAIFHPYHERIRRELSRRSSLGLPTVLVALHSFTPRFKGQDRPWHVGVLYNRDARLGRALLALLEAEPGLVVGDNEPYAVGDTTDYGIVNYGEKLGHPHVELEIRQDLIGHVEGQRVWAERLARILPLAHARALT